MRRINSATNYFLIGAQRDQMHTSGVIHGTVVAHVFLQIWFRRMEYTWTDRTEWHTILFRCGELFYLQNVICEFWFIILANVHSNIIICVPFRRLTKQCIEICLISTRLIFDSWSKCFCVMYISHSSEHLWTVFRLLSHFDLYKNIQTRNFEHVWLINEDVVD